MGIEFMKYIVSEETRWYVGIGVPNGTGVWQLGDSSEQNGSFKMRNLEYKQKILEQYLRLNEPVKLKKSDIIPIVNYSFPLLFARRDTNCKVTVKGA